ncbi:Core-2/I-Branching enzyme [Musa troglodytarum]|uniref:Core-2/I-Branching enzyme n=1 Tax=Musa troglodytarum TaxID=320322 RepID=A0A9E7JBG4_9LILI|nr:Core-2/I-Branching enzyme [Musa troglodytarum]
MKKRAPSSSSSLALAALPVARSRLRLGLQLILCLSVLACTLALIRICSRSPSTVDLVEVPLLAPPKIAFLFLARSNLPLDFVWHTFFQKAEEEKYSIYIHSEPGFAFDRTTTRSPFFFGRQLQNSIRVVWGEATMIEAERLLLAVALKDPANQRFALISDSCVPLYNFSYVYSYMMSSSKSFVDSFLDRKDVRYNAKMFPTIPKDRWRKGSQWITLVRKHAETIVADTIVFPVFSKFCKRRTGLALGAKQNNKEAAQKEHDCIPDEHYVQTLLSMSHLEDELERRTLTYTSWNQSIDTKDKRSWHPKTFEFPDASLEHIMEIRNINHVYYETEYRTEWCQCNAAFVPCFLFARKFSRSAAMRILNDGLLGPFDAGAFLFTNS